MKLKLRKRQSSSAAIVASDDGLLTQILLRLPVKFLLRFKCVSKHWLSLITSPYFSQLRIRHPIPPFGLLLHRSSHFLNPEHDFVPFNTQNPSKPPFRKLTFVDDDPSGIRILQSCNGLLFCCSFVRGCEPSRNYYIYNPTTRQYTTLPKPGGTKPVLDIHGMNLAYDPSKSTHYKVVCVRGGYELMSWNYKNSWHYQIDVYSSETRQWRVNCQSFRWRQDLPFMYGVVYWNGAIHWGWDQHSLYFDIDQEKLGKMPKPPDFPGWEESRIEYFGESCDHLHLLQVNNRRATLVNIFEMERDRTRWSLKYHVNLDAVATAFPQMIRLYDLPPTDYHHYAMTVLGLIRGEREEDSFMVLHIPGKATRYNLVDKSFYKLCDFAPPEYSYRTDEEDEIAAVSLQFNWFRAFQYFESHCIF